MLTRQKPGISVQRASIFRATHTETAMVTQRNQGHQPGTMNQQQDDHDEDDGGQRRAFEAVGAGGDQIAADAGRPGDMHGGGVRPRPPPDGAGTHWSAASTPWCASARPCTACRATWIKVQQPSALTRRLPMNGSRCEQMRRDLQVGSSSWRSRFKSAAMPSTRARSARASSGAARSTATMNGWRKRPAGTPVRAGDGP